MCRARLDGGAEGGSPGSWEVAVSRSRRAGGLLPVTAGAGGGEALSARRPFLPPVLPLPPFLFLPL